MGEAEQGWLEDSIDARLSAPETIILETDSTGVSTHGAQQHLFFNSYRGQQEYHPLLMADAETEELLSVRFRGEGCRTKIEPTESSPPETRDDPIPSD